MKTAMQRRDFIKLTATASGAHVLSATTYSKSVLRAVAGELASGDPNTDYFPSYEIVTGHPFGGSSFADNLRSVAPEAIDRVMRVFFGAHGAELEATPSAPVLPEVSAGGQAKREQEICEEVLLEAFAPK